MWDSGPCFCNSVTSINKIKIRHKTRLLRTWLVGVVPNEPVCIDTTLYFAEQTTYVVLLMWRRTSSLDPFGKSVDVWVSPPPLFFFFAFLNPFNKSELGYFYNCWLRWEQRWGEDSCCCTKSNPLLLFNKRVCRVQHTEYFFFVLFSWHTMQYILLLLCTSCQGYCEKYLPGWDISQWKYFLFSLHHPLPCCQCVCVCVWSEFYPILLFR